MLSDERIAEIEARICGLGNRFWRLGGEGDILREGSKFSIVASHFVDSTRSASQFVWYGIDDIEALLAERRELLSEVAACKAMAEGLARARLEQVKEEVGIVEGFERQYSEF